MTKEDTDKCVACWLREDFSTEPCAGCPENTQEKLAEAAANRVQYKRMKRKLVDRLHKEAREVVGYVMSDKELSENQTVIPAWCYNLLVAVATYEQFLEDEQKCLASFKQSQD